MQTLVAKRLRCTRPYLDLIKTASPSPLLSFILNLTTATHCTSSSTVSDKKTPEHPELSCSCCHQNAKIFSHHSCS